MISNCEAVDQSKDDVNRKILRHKCAAVVFYNKSKSEILECLKANFRNPVIINILDFAITCEILSENCDHNKLKDRVENPLEIDN